MAGRLLARKVGCGGEAVVVGREGEEWLDGAG